MQFERLELERQRYGEFKGQIVGKISVSGDRGDMTLAIGPDTAKALIDICAEGLVDHAKGVAADLVSDLIENHDAPSALTDQ